VEDKSARVLAEEELAEPSEHRIGRCTPCVRNIQGQRLPDIAAKNAGKLILMSANKALEVGA
jgi:hypothetical protein